MIFPCIDLMHPRQPELERRDQSNLKDDTGKPVIRPLLEKALEGGGFVEYRWPRPSQQKWSWKLGYVVPLPNWHWMIGTGVYLDDVDATTEQIRASSATAIGETMRFIAVIAVLAVLVVAALGVALNVSQQRLADSKLRRLTWQVVDAQEVERARVARCLHDEVVQDLIAVKCVLEAALVSLKSDLPHGNLTEPLEQGLAGLTQGLDAIRKLSHDLRPPLQGERLPARLEQIAAAFSERTGVTTTVDVPGSWQLLSPEAATAFLRVTQQALDNVERHARASQVVIRLIARGLRGSSGTTLTVSDDGCGFDVAAVDARASGGIGLLNMRERIEAVGGRIFIRSSPKGTEIEASLPETVVMESGHRGNHHDDNDDKA